MFQRDALGGGIVCNDGEAAAVLEVERDLRECGGSHDVLARGGADRIESKAREDVPGAHLAGILVAGKASRGVGVAAAKNILYPLPGFLGIAGKGVEVWNMMAGLVAMPVVVFVEEDVEPGACHFLSAHGIEETLRIVGYVPAVVDVGAFGEPGLRDSYVGGGKEGAVGVAAVHPSAEYVKDIAPVL